jgi:SPP1 family predicted phage head-tail adaptor
MTETQSQYDRRPRPGAMHEPLRVERRIAVVQPDGQEAERWESMGIIYAEPQLVTVAEQSIADVSGQRYDRRWRTWHMPMITLDTRLIDADGVAYYVIRIDDPDGRRRDMIVHARRAEPRI